MKVRIICVGKIKEKYLNMGINEYLQRLSNYVKVEIIELNDEKAPEKFSEAQLLQVIDVEGNRILDKISENDYVIALAIEGKQKSSEELGFFLKFVYIWKIGYRKISDFF